MEQLLSIKAVPMRYEMTVTRARLEYQAQQSQIQQERIKGGLEIQNKPARLLINTAAARESMTPTLPQSIKQAAQKGLQAAQDVSAQYALEAKQMMEAKPGQDALGQIFAQRAALPTGEFQLDFIPKVGPEITFEEPDFRMKYQADKLKFDTRVQSGSLEYVPGDISMNITQWPDVVIEYMGKPQYVPPSAAERFEASA